LIWIILTIVLLVASIFFFYFKIGSQTKVLLKGSLKTRPETKSRVALLEEMKVLTAHFEKPEGILLEVNSLGGGRIEIQQTKTEAPGDLDHQPEVLAKLDSMSQNLSLEACAELGKHQKFFSEYESAIARLRSALKVVQS